MDGGRGGGELDSAMHLVRWCCERLVLLKAFMLMIFDGWCSANQVNFILGIDNIYGGIRYD